MNSVFRVLEGIRLACGNNFKVFNYRHPEFILGFEIIQKIISIIGKMLKQVQHDIVFITNLLTTHYSQFTKKVFAFTLAETLIVMGIIGVIAALTLPNLNQSTGNKEKVTKLQKIYSNLEDALGRATVVYGPTDGWCSGLTDANCIKRHFERITEFMKYSKVCTVSDACSLFAANSSDGGERMSETVILSDGSTVGFSHNRWVIIDVNGTNKGPNKRCEDVFEFPYDSNGFKPTLDKNLDGNDRPYGDPNKCGAWIILNGNMDYLKCYDLKFAANTTTCK